MVAATEVQGKRIIRVWLGGDVVIAVNIAFIGLKVALRVIHSDGPESVHWHVHYVQEIGRAAIIVVVLPLNTPLAAVLAPKLMSGFIEPLHTAIEPHHPKTDSLVMHRKFYRSV